MPWLTPAHPLPRLAPAAATLQSTSSERRGLLWGLLLRPAAPLLLGRAEHPAAAPLASAASCAARAARHALSQGAPAQPGTPKRAALRPLPQPAPAPACPALPQG